MGKERGGNGQEKSKKSREDASATSVKPLHKVGSRLSGRVATCPTTFSISARRADHESAIKFCGIFDAAELILFFAFDPLFTLFK
jgi:hypothetical protein